MADPFVAEIRVFPFNFPPTGWAACDGQLMPISQNTALFALLGTVYGGDGKSNFAIPNLQGSVPMHPGQGPGLSLYELGQSGGSETIQLLQSQIPSHTHFVEVSDSIGDNPNPSGNALAKANVYVPANSSPAAALAPQALAPTGGNQSHPNLMPGLTMNFCIALQGVFPPRS